MITAARVIDDPANGRVRFQGGRLQLFGVTLPLLPVFSVGTDGDGATGWLVPDTEDFEQQRLRNRPALLLADRAQPRPDGDPACLHRHLAGDRGKLPPLNSRSAPSRPADSLPTAGSRTPTPMTPSRPSATAARLFRGQWQIQLDPLWSVTGFLRVASDKTVTRRYDITRDDRLRNFINAERITPDSYISIAGWAFQGLRVDDVQRHPDRASGDRRALPPEPPVLGGMVQLQANSLPSCASTARTRSAPSPARAGTWRRLTPMGQELT
jgi:LPS-assembly protein